MIDVADGEREHGRSLLVEFAPCGAHRDPCALYTSRAL